MIRRCALRYVIGEGGIGRPVHGPGLYVGQLRACNAFSRQVITPSQHRDRLHKFWNPGIEYQEEQRVSLCALSMFRCYLLTSQAMPSTAIPETQGERHCRLLKYPQRIVVSRKRTLDGYSIANLATCICWVAEHPVLQVSAQLHTSHVRC